MAVGDGSKIRESLRKKSNKTHLKQFEKLGRLEFQRVRQFEEIAAEFDEIVDLYDFRQGALYGSTPFHDDPSKRAILRSLYEVSDLLHTTVWRLDGRIISAHIGFHHGNQVSLGYLAHSPILAKHSPGRLHLYQLGLLLAEEGVPELDLTAGGDSYKDHFATYHDQVHLLTIFFSAPERLRAGAKAVARRAAKRALGLVSITPDDIRRTGDRVNSISHRLMEALPGFGASAQREGKWVVYHRNRAAMAEGLADQPIFRRDALADLLVYRPPSARDPSRRDFLSDALARLERGDHVYTCIEGGLLISRIWSTRLSGPAGRNHSGLVLDFPRGSVLLDGFAAHSSSRDQGLFRTAVASALTDLASSGDPNQVLVIVDRDDLAARRVLAGLGFDDQPPPSVEGTASNAERLSVTADPSPSASVFHNRRQPACTNGP